MMHPLEESEIRPVLSGGYYTRPGAWGNKTYNEPTTLVVNILLQRRLTQMSGKLEALERAPRGPT